MRPNVAPISSGMASDAQACGLEAVGYSTGKFVILEQARMLHELEGMDHIKYAGLERTGGISVVPRTETG